MYGFVYLVHDARANYSAAKMHAIPLCLLFLQPTFVPRSCARTMVVEHVVHFTSDCTHIIWVSYSVGLMCLHALQLSRVRLKRYFIFIYLVGQKTPQFKWISTSISPILFSPGLTEAPEGPLLLPAGPRCSDSSQQGASAEERHVWQTHANEQEQD